MRKCDIHLQPFRRLATVAIASLVVFAAIFPASDAIAAAPSAGDAALFERLDVNNDGILSTEEIPPDHRRLFARLLRRAGVEDSESLTREEFLDALIPSRPKKPIEAKQPATLPGAEAVRYLLLSLDTNRNSVIESEEVPEDLQRVFAAMLERLDRNESGALEPIELSRGGRRFGQLAARYIATREIDVAAELKKLEKAQGEAARRFDRVRTPVEMLADPKQARILFARLDANGDEQIDPDEVPDPFRRQIARFLRLADRDGDGALSEQEFLRGAKRMSRFMSRGR